MSGFIVLCRDNCIEVVSDGATYDPDGRLMLVKAKAIAMREIPAAIFGRGAENIVGTLAHTVAITSPILDIAGQSNTFDDLMKRIELDLAPKLRERIEALGPIPAEAQSELAVAGFSRAMGPSLAIMRTFGLTYNHDDGTSERLAPWKFYRLPQYWCAGPDINEEIGAAGLTWDDLCRDGLRPYAVDFMEAMRRKKDTNPLVEGDIPRHGIGGHVQLVTITRDDAQSEILHVWDDPIGEMIDPFRSAA